MRKNNHNGKKSNRVRLSANITREEKQGWGRMVELAAEKEGVKNPDNGTYIARIIRNELRLDQPSMSKYVKTHKRDEDPAS